MTEEKTNHYKIITLILLLLIIIISIKFLFITLETNEKIEKLKQSRIDNSVLFDEWKLSNVSRYEHQRESILYKNSRFQTGIIENNTYYCMWGNYEKSNESYDIFFDIKNKIAILEKKDLSCFAKENLANFSIDNCVQEIKIEDW